MYYYCRLLVTLTLADEGTEDRQGCVAGHELRGIGIVQALADVLHDGSLGMELYADGTPGDGYTQLLLAAVRRVVVAAACGGYS